MHAAFLKSRKPPKVAAFETRNPLRARENYPARNSHCIGVACQLEKQLSRTAELFRFEPNSDVLQILQTNLDLPTVKRG